MQARGIYFVLVALVFVALAASSLIRPRLSYGDSASDINVMVAGENFANYGFAQSGGLPVFGYRSAYSGCCVYTHYPAFPYWLNGWLRSLGVETLFGFRVVALLFSLITACLLPIFFFQLGLSAPWTFLASGLFILHSDFLQYSDSLHQFPLDFLTSVLCLICWSLFLKTRKWFWPVLSFLAFSVNTWTSFEHFLYVPVLILGLTWLQGNLKKDFWVAGLVCSAALVTMILRLWQQAHFLGGLDASLKDLLGAAGHRSSISFIEYLDHVQKRFINLNSALVPLFLWSLNPNARKQWQAHDLKIIAIFALAGFSWWIAMRQHFAIHGHTNHLFLGFFAVAGSMLVQKALAANTRGAHIATALSAIVVLINLGKTPIFNRFLSLDPRAHERIQLIESTQDKLITLSQRSPADTVFTIPLEEAVWAFPLTQDFRMLPMAEMCLKNPERPTILSKDGSTFDVYKRCKDFYGAPQDLGSVWVFDSRSF